MRLTDLMGIIGIVRRDAGEAHGETLILQTQAFRVVIAAAQTGDVLTEGAQEFPVLALIGLPGQLAEGDRITGGDESGQMIGQGPLAGLSELMGMRHEMFCLGQGGLLEEPFAVGSLFPLGKVGRANRLAAEGRRQDGLDLRHGVEPDDDLFAGLAFTQTVVDLLANQMGKPGDFAVGHIIHRLKLVKTS